MDPPASDAVHSGTSPPVMAAADPPLEPPGVRSTSHGFLVMPWSLFFVKPVKPNSGVLVFPTTIAPAVLSLATWMESFVAMLSLNGMEP